MEDIIAPSTPSYSLADIRATLAASTASYATRATSTLTRECDNHRYARSMLELCRMDDEEVATVAKEKRKSVRAHGAAHRAARGKAGLAQPSVDSAASKVYTDAEEAARAVVFTLIQDLKKSLKKCDYPLEVNLQVARLYVTLELEDKCIPFFQISTRVVPFTPVPVTVKEQAVEDRKLERMGKPQRATYLEEKRAAAAEDERRFYEKQRVRVMSSHFEIGKALLVCKESEAAVKHFRVWMGMGESGVEGAEGLSIRREIDRLCSEKHDLKECGLGMWKDNNYSDVVMFVDRSLGSLRDLHVEVLEDLLTIEPTNDVWLSRLGRLYCLLREFDKAQALWERWTEVTQGAHIGKMASYKHTDFYSDKLVKSPRFRNEFGSSEEPFGRRGEDIRIYTEFGPGGDEFGNSVGALGAGGNRVGGWSVDEMFDRVEDAKRRDFSDFRSGDMAKRSSGQVSGGKHIGSKTIVYAVPPGGWNDDTTPMRKSLGGMRAAMSSGLEKVEDETRRVAGDVIYGYKVKGDMIRNQKGMKGLLKATVNTDQETGNTSQASLDLEGVADQQLYRDLQNSEGELKGMLELRKNTSRKLAVSKAVWEKGGSLPPRLYSEHDFRIMAGECDLANPDAPAKVASFSVFEQDYSDLPPLVRFRKSGSALTKHEQLRLDRISARPGKFGAVPERNIVADPVQTFAGRSMRPTAKMQEMFDKAQGGAEKKKAERRAKMKEKAAKKEAAEVRKRGEKLKAEIHAKRRFKMERKFTIGLGGSKDLIPVPLRREGGRTEAEIVEEGEEEGGK